MLHTLGILTPAADAVQPLSKALLSLLLVLMQMLLLPLLPQLLVLLLLAPLVLQNGRCAQEITRDVMIMQCSHPDLLESWHAPSICWQTSDELPSPTSMLSGSQSLCCGGGWCWGCQAVLSALAA